MKTTEEVLEILRGFDSVSDETILIEDALHRVLSQEIYSEEDMPNFSRSSMDGYAVRARDTFGASDSLPACLALAGEIIMGDVPIGIVEPGTAMRISTGGMIPDGADAVVMVEYCRKVDEKSIEISRPVAPRENVIGIGDDIKKGDEVFSKGDLLKPQDIGLLAGLGIQKIQVHKRPRIAIISTGNEVIPIDKQPAPGQIRDINSYTLRAFCRQKGATPIAMGLCQDNFNDMKEMVGNALDISDAVWISGGSSMGTRDITLKVLASFDRTQILVNGIAISPGKPTIIARTGDKAIFGLPGRAASAMTVAEILLAPFLARLSGENEGICRRSFLPAGRAEGRKRGQTWDTEGLCLNQGQVHVPGCNRLLQDKF